MEHFDDPSVAHELAPRVARLFVLCDRVRDAVARVDDAAHELALRVASNSRRDAARVCAAENRLAVARLHRQGALDDLFEAIRPGRDAPRRAES